MQRVLIFFLSGECFWKKMYPFGPDQEDEEMTTGDIYSWRCQRISGPEIGTPFYNQRHYKLYVRYLFLRCGNVSNIVFKLIAQEGFHVPPVMLHNYPHFSCHSFVA